MLIFLTKSNWLIFLKDNADDDTTKTKIKKYEMMITVGMLY